MNFVNPENTIINSINGEKEKKEKLLKVIKKYPEAKIILLTMDERGIPNNIEARIEIAEKIINEISTCGIKKENIFVDCLVEPVSVNVENAKKFIKCLKEVKTKFPEVKTTCGLSNISFGLPVRKIINKYFLALCIYEGLDSALIDPTISDIRESLYAINVLHYR